MGVGRREVRCRSLSDDNLVGRNGLRKFEGTRRRARRNVLVGHGKTRGLIYLRGSKNRNVERRGFMGERIHHSLIGCGCGGSKNKRRDKRRRLGNHVLVGR
jgi:hypothetical protein